MRSVPASATPWQTNIGCKTSFRFTSMHAGGVLNGGYGDGSVKTFSTTADYRTWLLLGSMADSIVLDSSGDRDL
jgi:hypothetical protein